MFFSISIVYENDAYGERSVTYKKTLDIKKEIIENMLFDKNNYSKLLSSEAKLLDIIKKDDSKEVRVLVDIGACTIKTGLQHYTKNDLHVIKFVSGSLKGSTLEILLEKTWSYDGVRNEGTTITIDFTIQDIPCVPDFLVGDEVIEFALDKSLLDLEHKAKKIQKEIDVSNKQITKPLGKSQIISSNSGNQVRNNSEISPINTISSTNTIEEKVKNLAYDIAMKDDPQIQLELFEKIKNLRGLSKEKTSKIENSKIQFTTYDDINQEDSTQFLENIHDKVNSINEANSSLITINSEKFQIEKYKPNWLEISGMIDDPKRGNTVLLTITKPDETKQVLKIFHTKDGYYQTKLFLDNYYPDGTYSINAVYGNEESSVFFQIQK